MKPHYVFKYSLQSQTLLVTMYMRQKEGQGVTTTACSPVISICHKAGAVVDPLHGCRHITVILIADIAC